MCGRMKKHRNLCSLPKVENPLVLMSNVAIRRKFLIYQTVLALEEEVEIQILFPDLGFLEDRNPSKCCGSQNLAILIRQCLWCLPGCFTIYFTALWHLQLSSAMQSVVGGSAWCWLGHKQELESSPSSSGFGTDLGSFAGRWVISLSAHGQMLLLICSMEVLWSFVGVCDTV